MLIGNHIFHLLCTANQLVVLDQLMVEFLSQQEEGISGERGGRAWLKLLEKKLFGISALSELVNATPGELSSFNVGIDESFLLMYLMACQKLLQLCGFKLLKYAALASLNLDTNLVRAQ